MSNDKAAAAYHGAEADAGPMIPTPTDAELPAAQAIGDDAVAAGMVLVPGGDPVRGGDDEVNKTRDYVAQYAKRTGPLIDLWVQPAAPAHKAGRVWIKTT